MRKPKIVYFLKCELMASGPVKVLQISAISTCFDRHHTWSGRGVAGEQQANLHMYGHFGLKKGT